MFTAAVASTAESQMTTTHHQLVGPLLLMLDLADADADGGTHGGDRPVIFRFRELTLLWMLAASES
jgi:hypothetical protein